MQEEKMYQIIDPAVFAEQVKLIRAAVEKLRVMGADFPAVDRNALRMLASLKMIELNLGDAAQPSNSIRLEMVNLGPGQGRSD